ncbi:MAG: hypothetical protein IRZ03_18365 [Acidobacterium ailaaui]|nr:hypothetical protein [Pseudacidobacterium ailaaui]
MPGDVTPATDPIITQVSHEYVNEKGNTVVVGYPPSMTVTYEGTPGLGEWDSEIDPPPPTDEPQ